MTRSFAIGVLSGLLLANTASAQTTITFEEFAAGTELRNQYAAQGVHFQGSTIDTIEAPHSGTRVLYSVPPGVEAFSFPGPLVIEFDGAQRSVGLFTWAWVLPETASLTAFDASGNVVAQDGPKSVTPGQTNTLLEVHVDQPTIRRVELLYANDGDEVCDDLTFDGLSAGDLPKDPPLVEITSPTPFQQTGAETFSVEGAVTGPKLDSHAVMTRHVSRPPGSTTTADYSYTLDLPDHASDTRLFSQLVWLDVGPQTITVDAENLAGLHGTASVVIDALPDPIRMRLAQEGGTSALGAFQFGSPSRFNDCAYAVYLQAAVAAVNGATSLVRGEILQKWLANKDPGGFPALGCPLGEERVTAGAGRAQDFVGGRIYASAHGVFVVPSVFASAIDALGGEAGVGLPISEPTSDSRPAFYTWLFQRFARAGVALASTLEIRGASPRLYVERQAGDGALFANVLGANNPTLVESFDCATTAGPCPVAPPPDEPLFPNAAALCNNREFDWVSLVSGITNFTPDPPEWVPVHDDYVPVPIWGVLFDVHLASGDNPFTHRNHFDPCPTPLLEALVNETICPSDWDLKIRPLSGYRSLQPLHRDAVQIEFERVDFQHQMVAYGDPTLGDLVFASGRYVVDCGHGGSNKDAFKTEIHPPAVYAAVRSAQRNGEPATEADIWVNRFMVGGDEAQDAIDFDIQPPPRPSPQALIGATTPGDQNSAVRVSFQMVPPYGPVRVHVTATRGLPEVTSMGEMKPRGDGVPFGFDGRLQVYWTAPLQCDLCTVGQTRSCGNCGTQTCTADCSWSACTSQGSCTPGATQACGNCGTQTCNSSCTWSSCVNHGQCTPGDSQSCCPCGSRGCSCAGERFCQDSCTWSGCMGYACGSGECP